MKITALSDLHGHLPKIENDTDLVLIAGEICAHGKPLYQLNWLRDHFKPWLKSINAPVFGVAGNHDWPFYGQEYPAIKDGVQKLDLPWTYLEDSGAEFQGLKIWGTPWQREFYDWAFNLRADELPAKWALIPEDTDILICHGPPYGFGDLVLRDNVNVGCPALLRKIEDIKPKLVVFGHIHCGRGNWDYDGVRLANVTVVNEQYKMVYPPFEYELGDQDEKRHEESVDITLTCGRD